MKNNAKDPFEEFIKKWTIRAERVATFLSWIMHLFLIVCISVWLIYFHLAQMQGDFHKDISVIELRNRAY
jgi:hypothetical protein